MTAEQLEELLGKVVKAPSLAEHDQIDLLQLCEDLRENAPNERLRQMRSIRAARIEGRLRETQAALTDYSEASKWRRN